MKVLHFVTGGFSGATKVAIDIISAHNMLTDVESLLVLRQKKTTTIEKLAEVKDKGISCQTITGTTHLSTILALKNICKDFKPNIIVCHGFPEHIIGRWAAKIAKVPFIVQVEHNSKERYTFWKLNQSRYLSAHTDLSIGVSKGVADILRSQKLQSTIIDIPNGIDTKNFGGDNLPDISERVQDIIMVGRFARSKDHPTLIKALAILKTQGYFFNLTLVGSGKPRYETKVHKLVAKYGLENQVNFVKYSNKINELLVQHKVFVMSSNFEGLNLSVLEAMACSCIVVGSRTKGVEELIDDGVDGFLFDIGNATQLSNILKETVLQPKDFQKLGINARNKVISSYDKNHMSLRYYDEFLKLMGS